MANAEEGARTVSVQGQGSVQYVPDRAAVTIAISDRQAKLAPAQARAGEVAAAVLKVAGKLGIQERFIDTTGASVQPDYRWNRQREEQELVGYIAQRNMQIEVRDLEVLGELVEGAVRVGANQVSPPHLYSSKARELHRQALELAAKDAQANAETLATALNAKLGEVVSIATHGAALPAPMPRGRMMATADTEGAQSYNAGERTFEATVQAVFALQ